jgi:hypothetical protein
MGPGQPDFPTQAELRRRWEEAAERMLARIPKDPKERKRYIRKRVEELMDEEYRFCPHCGKRVP